MEELYIVASYGYTMMGLDTEMLYLHSSTTYTYVDQLPMSLIFLYSGTQ